MLNSVTAQFVTLSKLQRPRSSSRPVHRARLLSQLSASAGLTLVVAPAGYGKTTLLSAWLESCTLPSAWLSLDEHDNDLIVFCTYLVAAVRTLFPDACHNTLELLSGITSPPADVISQSLSNELSAFPQEFILVLDDYHLIRQREIHSLLTELTRHLPQSLHLVLAARHDPVLPVSGLRARGDVIELREADLRFSQEETASFLREHMQLDVGDLVVSSLQRYTEGWVAGLRLAALYLRDTGHIANLAVDRLGSNRYIMSYLMAEVLAQVPEAIQEFLLKTSLPDRFCGPLCQAMTGLNDQDVRSCLAWLEDNNLFVRSVDEERHWFHYHQLFQKLLINQLEQRHPVAEVRALHLKASAWFAQYGYAEEALHHALAAGDASAAVQVVAQHRCQAMNDEQWHRLDRWVRLFPRAVIDMQPELLLSEAWLMHTHHFRLSEMAALVDRAGDLIGHMALETAVADRLQGEIDTIRAILLYFAGDGASSLAAAQRALDRTPPEWWYVRAQAYLLLSAGYLMKGDLRRAYAAQYNSGEPDRPSAFQMRMHIHTSLIHSMAADLSGMAACAMQVLQASDRSGSQVETTAWAHYLLGVFHYERNNLAQAERYLAPIVSNPYQGHLLCSLNSAAALALIRQTQGQPDQAREIAEMMVSLALETDSDGGLYIAKGFEAELALRQGRLAEASQWAEQFDGPLATPQPFFYCRELTLVHILLAQNTPASRRQAGQMLSTSYDYYTSIHHTALRIDVLALQAVLYQTEGNLPAALDALAQALALAEPGGYIRLFIELGEPMQRLLTAYVREHWQGAYATRILAAYPDALSPSEARRRANDALLVPLTPRELEVLALLEKHYTDKQIAETLVVSVLTVRSHLEHIGEKLGGHGRHPIVEIAKAQGLL